jgi:hypothetical protein
MRSLVSLIAQKEVRSQGLDPFVRAEPLVPESPPETLMIEPESSGRAAIGCRDRDGDLTFSSVKGGSGFTGEDGYSDWGIGPWVANLKSKFEPG